MGGNQSTPSSSSNPNPPTATPPTTMPSSISPATHDSKPQLEPTPEAGPQESSDPPPTSEKPPESSETEGEAGAAEGADAGEEEECGFCLFMKAGGCKEEFVAWEKCVEDGDRNNEDIAEKCFELTSTLKKCMEAHRDYYGPLLDAEEAAHEMAKKELEAEKAKEVEGVKGVEESATPAENSDTGGVVSVSDQVNETKDSVSAPSEQQKN